MVGRNIKINHSLKRTSLPTTSPFGYSSSLEEENGDRIKK
jgi:hypothetical protein